MGHFKHSNPIVASVAAGPYANYGNALIERSMLHLLGLPRSTPKFSVFARIDDALLEFINSHDALVVTGCTTLQDDRGHQRCFDEQFARIRVPKICFGGTFYCEARDRPSLRIARMYDRPIGVRDPWAFEYLRDCGIDCELIGCPTLLDSHDLDDWNDDGCGDLLISSTPPIEAAQNLLTPGRRRYLAHDPDSPGEPLAEDIFDNAALVVTSRLHAALPAIARGIRVRFYDQRHWHPDYRTQQFGSIRYSLLEHLGIPLDGSEPQAYPAEQIQVLKRSCRAWMGRAFAPAHEAGHA